VLVLAAVLAVLAACTADPDQGDPGPVDRLAAFVTAWQQMDFDAASDYTTSPAAAALMLDEVTGDLRPDQLTITTGDLTRSGNQATATVTFTWQLPDAGTWTYPATWAWKKDRDWELDWSPAVIHPKLGERQTLAARTTAAEPGVLVDRNNNRIVQPVTVYSVVMMPARTPDVSAAAAALAPVLAPLDPTVTVDSIVAGVQQAQAEAAAVTATATATASGSATVSGSGAASGSAGGDGTPPADPASIGYTVTNLREADFLKVKPQLDAIPGLSFPSQVRNLPPSRDFAKAVLAQVTPVAEPMMKGTDGWSVVIVDSTGGVLETLEDHPAVSGQRVTLTLDSQLQQVAEQVLSGVGEPAVLLTMQPSSGEILTVAQNPAANAQGSIGLTGRYPPGSTFKIVTASAGMAAGLITPEKVVPCPGTWTVDGRLIRNHGEFDLGSVAVTRAFAYSCNTTFAQVSTQLPADALPAMALSYGVGLDYVIDGITTLTGSVPPAGSQVQKAENGFGQGQVLVTPFGELMMAATVAKGTPPLPVLIRGGVPTTVDQAPAEHDPALQAGIRTLMRAVVTEGTGTLDPALGDVYAKTGTAEYVGADGVPGSHAWVTGYRGDIAFVVFIAGGGESYRAVELLDRFLRQAPGLL
jgi:cell division protein FtsI/penicillin-binding protein 2